MRVEDVIECFYEMTQFFCRSPCLATYLKNPVKHLGASITSLKVYFIPSLSDSLRQK
jgi:hypothetical protein